MDWRHFPPFEQTLGTFAPPPRTITDSEGRTIDLLVYGDGPIEDEYDALVEFYLDFSLEHRSLGLPPVGERRIRRWLDVLLGGENVLAWDGDRVIGQATLVESDENECEMVIFLHQDYHGARIGTRLTETLLSHGREQGIRRVWLLVERENYMARNLYHDVGFAITESHGYDVEMAVNLS